MSDIQHSIRSETRPKIYSLNTAAILARVTVEFIQECEREELIQANTLGDSKGYDHNTIRRLIRISHLHQNLGLDLTAIDYLLRMRRRIRNLQKQKHDMEQHMFEREQELMAEIQYLRKQLAQDAVEKPCN